MKSKTRFRYASISTSAKWDLQLLVPALKAGGLVDVYCDCYQDEHWSIGGKAQGKNEPETDIASLLAAIEGFRQEECALWQECRDPEIRIGFDAGDEPYHLRPAFSLALLERMARLRATLDISVWPKRSGRFNSYVSHQYLNTDLDLTSSSDLTALNAALIELDCSYEEALHCHEGQWSLIFSGDGGREPELAILRHLDVIESLSGEARRAWDSCDERVFDIGIEGCDAPFVAWHRLSPGVLKRMVAAGVSLRLTIYRRESIRTRLSRMYWSVRGRLFGYPACSIKPSSSKQKDSTHPPQAEK